jgi:hypothetical protein
MNREQLAKLSDKELLEVAKKNKPSPVFDAFFIGLLVGIVIYGVVANAWGFFILIPLFLIYLFLKKPRQYQAIQDELKKRNLQ